MTRIVQQLHDISGLYRALYCDLWGCLHNGKTPFPEAVEALQRFRTRDGIVLLLTNSPRPRASVIAQLDGLGVPRDCYDEVASSGDAAQYALLTGAVGHRIHHLGPERDNTFFTDFADDLHPLLASEPPIIKVPLDEAEGIVCTGLFDDRTETPDDYRATLLFAKHKGLKLLCANPDIQVDLGHQRIYCAGAIAQAYDAMGGESLYFGKPHPPIYDLARRRLAALDAAVSDPEILCIGDGINTDIRGGLNEGLDTLFITGGLEAGRFGPDDNHPDLALLKDWLEDRMMQPTFAMGKLG